LRGQLRHCLSRQTHRIPLASPFGHYRHRTWHQFTFPSTMNLKERAAMLALAGGPAV
jgi:hypothetical protein